MADEQQPPSQQPQVEAINVVWQGILDNLNRMPSALERRDHVMEELAVQLHCDAVLRDLDKEEAR